MNMTEKSPLISVIVPVYNVAEYLDQCVDSIVRQTYRNLEIILVDDGSPDECPALCDAWRARDERIKVIHQPN
ncbi:MAG: glycosyltransferase family 2 protein, partial [Victivallales bacterium]|nr:glycosyltransferase family 2 protein [Victivallales bacterium]